MPRKNGITLHQVRSSLGEEVSPKKQKQAHMACFLLFVSHRIEIEHAAARNKKKPALSALVFWVERKTGFEPATPTLARSCSTN